MILGKEVRLTGLQADRYGRVVADVFDNGHCVNPGTIFSRCEEVRWLGHRVLEECPGGCDYETASCLDGCLSDVDCPQGTWFEGAPYCSGTRMVEDEHGYFCQDGACVDNFMRQVPLSPEEACSE